MKILKHLPNAITLLNLSCGLYAIVLLFGQKIQIACLLVFLAAIFDFLDGFAAKLLKAHSELGKQLDSLADVVTFGVVPSLILYQLVAYAYQYQSNAIGINDAYFIPAFLIALSAAVRLGRFNSSPVIAGQFSGLPTPAIACLVATLPLIAFMNNTFLNEWLLNPYVLYGLVLLLCFFMVSELPLLSFKTEKWTVKGNESRIALLIISIISIALLNYAAGPIIFVAYLLCSFIEFSILQKAKKTGDTNPTKQTFNN
jgi:CDP-diacylglycerol--serine O-phosphatidyltransferase